MDLLKGKVYQLLEEELHQTAIRNVIPNVDSTFIPPDVETNHVYRLPHGYTLPPGGNVIPHPVQSWLRTIS